MKYLGVYLEHLQNMYAENYSIDRRNQRRYKEMERFTMFLDWKTEHSRDVNYPQIDLEA